MPGQVIISGALGRMGRQIAQAVTEHPELILAGALERPGHPLMGADIGPQLGLEPLGFKLCETLTPIPEGPGVLIDFTAPQVTLNYAAQAAKLGIAVVSGTTGLSADELARLKTLAAEVPIVWAPNMSLGVNLMYKIAAQMAKALPDYDLEIVETHHRLKKDAPSGTALKLYEHLALARDLPVAKAAVYGRQGQVGERTSGEIGVLAVRGGEVVGDHTVYFCGPGERLELTHRAQTRDTFAKGAARAAAWIIHQKPGLYDLGDVLGF